jgi:predicted XRE-type DNA-binding protein
MKKFKEEELIMYIYKDCTPELTAAINQAIKEDTSLKTQLEVLQRSVEQLDKLKLQSPSKQSIKAILQYAKNAQKE